MSRSRPESLIAITAFEPQLSAVCPETAHILRNAALTVHPRVTAVTLHGSRGPRGDYRPDSDVDMCLIVNTEGVTERSELAALLRAVLDKTLTHCRGTVEADLAVAYDRQGCGLSCAEPSSSPKVVG